MFGRRARKMSESSVITTVKYDSFHVKTHISIVKLCYLFFSLFGFLGLRYYTSAIGYLLAFLWLIGCCVWVYIRVVRVLEVAMSDV